MQELTLPFKGTVNDLLGYIERFSESYARNAENTDDIFLANMAWPEKREAGQVIHIGTQHTRRETGQEYTQEYTTEGWLEVVRQTDQQTELIGHSKTVEAEKFVNALMRKIELDGLRVGAMRAQSAARGKVFSDRPPVTRETLYRMVVEFAGKAEQIWYDIDETAWRDFQVRWSQSDILTLSGRNARGTLVDLVDLAIQTGGDDYLCVDISGEVEIAHSLRDDLLSRLGMAGTAQPKPSRAAQPARDAPAQIAIDKVNAYLDEINKDWQGALDPKPEEKAKQPAASGASDMPNQKKELTYHKMTELDARAARGDIEARQQLDQAAIEQGFQTWEEWRAIDVKICFLNLAGRLCH